MMMCVLVPRWLMQEKHNDTGVILVLAEGPYVQQRRMYCVTCPGVLVVGDTSLSERGREAPKSLEVLRFD